MTIFYPDISHFESGLHLRNDVPIVVAKASQGTTFADPTYGEFLNQARAIGAVFVPYHFVEPGNADKQARWCIAITGKRPIMADFEPWTDGSGVTHQPSMGDLRQFCAEFVAQGGRVALGYIPKWYWEEIGSPDLTWMNGFGMGLVSSAFPEGGYSEVGIGWESYGGMTPVVWQYTDAQPYDGMRIDFNAYKGSKSQFLDMVMGGTAMSDVTLSFGPFGYPGIGYAKDRAGAPGAMLADIACGEMEVRSGWSGDPSPRTLRLQRMEAKLDTLNAKLDAVNVGINALQKAVSDLSSGNVDAKAVVDELAKRLASEG